MLPLQFRLNSTAVSTAFGATSKRYCGGEKFRKTSAWWLRPVLACFSIHLCVIFPCTALVQERAQCYNELSTPALEKRPCERSTIVSRWWQKTRSYCRKFLKESALIAHQNEAPTLACSPNQGLWYGSDPGSSNVPSLRIYELLLWKGEKPLKNPKKPYYFIERLSKFIVQVKVAFTWVLPDLT